MKAFWVIIFSLTFCNRSFAQDLQQHRLWGKWQIIGYKELEIITPEMEGDENDVRERKQLHLNRGKGVFNIDSNYITTDNTFLEFDSCKFSLIHKESKQLRIVPNDYSIEYASSFDLWFDSNKVADDFMARLDNSYNKKTITVFDTDFKVDYGNETLKICFIDKDKIALYRSFDVIVLKRRKLIQSKQ